MCVVLELCQHPPEPPAPAAAAPASSAGEEASPTTGGPSWWERDPRAKAARGPPSTLVQMVCSGEDAGVRCATSEYKLSTGMAAASRCSTAVCYCGGGLSNVIMDDGRSNGDTAAASSHNDKPGAASGQRFEPPPLLVVPQPQPQQTPLEAGATTETRETSGSSTSSGPRSKFGEMATTVAESGTMARAILSGFTKPQRKPKGELLVPPTEEPPVFQGPPTNPREALSAARAATAGVRSFSAGIKVDVGGRGNGGTEAEAGRMPWASGGGAGGGSSDSGSGWGAQTAVATGGASTGGGGGAGVVDTSASARIVTALREDTLWAESLPDFIRKTMEAQKGGFGRQVALK